MTILTPTTRLLDKLAFLFDRLLDAFAVRHLRRTDVGIDTEFTLQPINDDLEVQLAHALK
jgi:hypothetical protein